MTADDQELERDFGPITVSFVHHDTASRNVGALLHAANDQLVNGAGVNAAVRSRGGIKLPQEATARLIEQVTPGAA